MPLFYINVSKASLHVEDIEGEEFVDLAAAKASAEESMLALVAEQVRAGVVVDIRAMEILDASKELVETITVGEVLLKVIPPTTLHR
jgi:hypothetical protein